MGSIFFYIEKQLKGRCKKEDLSTFSTMIGERITGYNKTSLLIKESSELTEEQKDIIKKHCNELAKERPIQYVLGETTFCGIKLKVNERVLIPRPETEELVNWIAKEGKKHILDIGTGSGCIGVALAKLTGGWISAFDISEDALCLARENAQENDVDIDFRRVDILHPEATQEKWDIIVSNPPYITEEEKVEMENNVLKYEPHLALFVRDEDPLLFYRAIADFANEHLEENGSLYFEINRQFGKETKLMLEEKGYVNVEVREDLFGNVRMVKAKKGKV